MSEGIVSWFNLRKGYGFIVENIEKKDLFVHFTDIKEHKKLTEGDKVIFDIANGEKGKKAINVDLVTKEEDVKIQNTL